jgi:cathepsin L
LAATQPTQINVNWTQQGKVSAVENQGICGACYAFSAVGNMESFALLSNQKNIELSQQQIIDCSWNYGNSGCNSGYIVKAFQYALDNGITSSSVYPFLGATGFCQINGGTFQINSIKVTKGCNGLQNQIVNSPISVSVDAKLWQSYQSGIFNECGNTLNHAVLLTGMTNTYWIVKNSWGTSWGQNGYISLSPGNTCGIC